jgi:TonB family protein
MKLIHGLILLLLVLSLPALGQIKKKAGHKPSKIITAAKIDTTAKAHQFTDVDQMPVPIKTATPEYPEAARKAGIQGTVWVNLLVGVDGKVKDVKVIKMNDGSPEIQQSALDAAKKYTFKPALKANKPVEVWATLPFNFKLK